MCDLCKSLVCVLDESESASFDSGDGTSPAGFPIVYSQKADVSTSDISGIMTGVTVVGGETVFTFGFTTGAADYENSSSPYDETDEYLSLSDYGEDMFRTAVNAWDMVTSLEFVETDGASAEIAIGGSSVPPTAWAYLPTGDGASYEQDIWVGVDKSYNELFVTETEEAYLGTYEYFVAMHELGHSLGLKHPTDLYVDSDETLDASMNSIEYTVMSYKSYVGAANGSYTVRGDSYPQSLMMLDIAAIQELYGADYTVNSGDTVYSFDTSTGEMMVDGVGTGRPSENIIFRTIWDGDGVDTFDLSNYTTDIGIDLNAGGHIDLDLGGASPEGLAWASGRSGYLCISKYLYVPVVSR